MKSLTQFTRKFTQDGFSLFGAEGRKCILKGWEKTGVTEIRLFTIPLFLRGILETNLVPRVKMRDPGNEVVSRMVRFRELPPSLFVKASAIWGECLNYRGKSEWGLLSGGGGAKKYPVP